MFEEKPSRWAGSLFMSYEQTGALLGSGTFGRHEHGTDKVLSQFAGSKLRVQQQQTIPTERHAPTASFVPKT
jgi:hypothetical protein